jgi:hypothetical protein
VHELENLAQSMMGKRVLTFFGFFKNSSDNFSSTFSMEIKVQEHFFDSSFDFPAPFFTGLTFPECFVSFDAHCLLEDFLPKLKVVL